MRVELTRLQLREIVPDGRGRDVETAALIAQLNPQPVDLRNPKALYLKSDKQRARAIREGHPGTGMFPDTTMTTQELTDTLAYLAVLRQQDSKRTSKP